MLCQYYLETLICLNFYTTIPTWLRIVLLNRKLNNIVMLILNTFIKRVIV